MTLQAARLLQEMDIHNPETQIALRCAPLIAGIKTASLLILKEEQLGDVQGCFRGTSLSIFAISSTSRKAILLACRRRELERYLAQKTVRQMLYDFGYTDSVLEKLLCIFAARYAAYLEGRRSFPHEMGLFLGYPPEDVYGFLKYGGKNFLCAGSWKVYAHKEEKMHLFRCFELAEEGLLQLLAQGFRMEELLKYA